jgi:hypothetical protein
MKKLFSIIIAALPMLLTAQSAERQVIGSAGGFAKGTGLQVSSTVGEAITATGTTTSVILTQGFQQPSSGTVRIDEAALGLFIKAYPNPTSDAVTLDLSTQQAMDIHIALYDMLGRQMSVTERMPLNGQMLHTVNMANFARGNYILRLTNTDGSLQKSIPIQKVD